MSAAAPARPRGFRIKYPLSAAFAFLASLITEAVAVAFSFQLFIIGMGVAVPLIWAVRFLAHREAHATIDGKIHWRLFFWGAL